MDSRPIGVFDSGVGGLTVFKALKRRLPKESLIYFGDTAHVPYGSKSKEAVTHFSKSVARFLVEKEIKLLVVACNTASALALDELKAELAIPVIGVIEPGIRAASANGGRKIGIIATEATIASNAYQARLKDVLKDVKVLAAACPLFVPLVEEGWWSHAVTRSVVKEYLGPLKKAGIDSLILGCTHYPLLKPVLKRAIGSRTRLIDSAEEISREVESALRTHKLEGSAAPQYRFFASDGPERFLRLAKRLLGVSIKNVEIHRFD